MAVYFNIIIPFQFFISELKDSINKNSINLYAENWNEKKGFYYKLIDFKSDNLTFFLDKDYRRFFFSSKLVEIKDERLILEENNHKTRVSFYDDDIFDYCIEGNGGREDEINIEIIKLRMISKTPDKQIQKFYNSLQSILKKTKEVDKGLLIGKHFDGKVYYYKTGKNMLSDFDKKDIQYIKQRLK